MACSFTDPHVFGLWFFQPSLYVFYTRPAVSSFFLSPSAASCVRSVTTNSSLFRVKLSLSLSVCADIADRKEERTRTSIFAFFHRNTFPPIVTNVEAVISRLLSPSVCCPTVFLASVSFVHSLLYYDACLNLGRACVLGCGGCFAVCSSEAS